MAGDDSGNVYIYDGIEWSDSIRALSAGTNVMVDCASKKSCAIMNGAGTAAYYDGAVHFKGWTYFPFGPTAISCAGSNFCVAVDWWNRGSITFNGSKWSTATPVTSGELNGVSCATPKFCVTVDNQGDAFLFNGPARTLTVTKIGTGSGAVTSDVTGISCGSTCSAKYVQGAVITLTATPDPGSIFMGWRRGGCSGLLPTCTPTLTRNRTVKAQFEIP